MMKFLKIFFFLFLLVGTIIILRNHQTESKLDYRVTEGKIFGTQYRVVYESSVSLDSVIRKALLDVDNSLSMFNNASTLARINRGETACVDSLFCLVFNVSKQVNVATEGAFDPTVAPAVNAWGFGIESKQTLSATQLDSIAELVDFSKVCIEGDSVIHREDLRIRLDFGAVAKGFGVDCVAETLRQCRVENFMVEIGGEVVVNGVNDKGEVWRIGVQKPTSDGAAIQEVIKLSNAAMATSGNYRNYYITEDGKRIAHTIDPRTVSPVAHSLLSATVVAPTCAIADAYATAFMVMGVEATKECLKHHPELSVYLIYQENESLQVYSTLPDL